MTGQPSERKGCGAHLQEPKNSSRRTRLREVPQSPAEPDSDVVAIAAEAVTVRQVQLRDKWWKEYTGRWSHFARKMACQWRSSAGAAGYRCNPPEKRLSG